MALFHRSPIATGRFRVLGVTPFDGRGTLIVNGVPQQRVHVSGLVEIDGKPPEAAAVDARLGIGQSPTPGSVLPVEVLRAVPLKIRVQWSGGMVQQQVQAAQQDAAAQVVAGLASDGLLQHTPGESDPLGVAFTTPHAAGGIADQLAAVLDTPISVDTEVGGVKSHLTANRSGHLSSAEAAELLRSGTAATAVVRGATRLPVPQAMLPNPDASLWDLDLEVHRPDGTTYRAATRVGFRSEARRGVLGAPGLTIPVRIDVDDESRVAVDGTTFDTDHPDAPPG